MVTVKTSDSRTFLAALLCALGVGGCGASDAPGPSVEEDPGAAEQAASIGDRVAIESYNYPGHYLRHRNALADLTTLNTALDRADATFTIRAGLSSQSPVCVSFESTNYPGHYLRHQNARIRLDPFVDQPLYRSDATFCMVAALQPGASAPWISLVSDNYRTHYIRHRQGHFYLESGGGPFAADATFRLVSPP
ncbi:hypothetical protein BE08_03180 [Sorangium cellulosum]|uniref:Alpha-L-arabinofuranosidase B arabinose-binding domain-containing protein n=1 Tax=Sorangium cellulosum TaxID=56 RepID=A0A150PFT2_SORCE|nr:hypothetical protein BE08_03180 [Sorangium cellulosum]